MHEKSLVHVGVVSKKNMWDQEVWTGNQMYMFIPSGTKHPTPNSLVQNKEMAIMFSHLGLCKFGRQ